jgi:molecular chaperone DnaJ
VASQSWIDKDFYDILGVPKTATPEEIKKRYRKLAKELHPDTNAGKDAEERFKTVGEAYSVLSNKEKRAEYDKLRDAIAAGAVPGGFGGGYPGGFRAEDFGFSEEFDVDDLLRQIFGSGFGGGFSREGGFGRVSSFGRQQTRSRRGRDVETTVPLSFEEAAEGTERKVRLDLPSGRREFTVRIPPGVADGARIRVRARGEEGSEGGESGDLYVRAQVAPHRFFGRTGQNLTLTLPVTFTEAALGAEVKVPTLNGAVTLKVPAGTSSGRTFRLRGHGVKGPDGSNGDLLATVQVAVPEKLSKKQQELVKELADDAESPRKHLGV